MAISPTILFYELDKPDRYHMPADWDKGNDFEQVTCPINPTGHMRGGKRTPNVRIVLKTKKLEDFIWTRFGYECYVGDHTFQILRDNRITGFEVQPVTARFKNSNESPPRLWELVVTGWAGMAGEGSGIRIDEDECCPACGFLHYTGMTNPSELINVNQWDGSDIFMVWPLPNFFMVTERFVRIIKENRLTGARFIPVNELKPTDGFSPGRLHYHMPDDRAKLLGEPLGIY